MSKRIFTAEQITNLSANKNVIRCSPKSITYNYAFKMDAIKRCKGGVGIKQVFEEAGFDLNVIGHKTPKACIRRWRRTCTRKGAVALSDEKRGKSVGGSKGRPRLRGLTDTEKIKQLELTVLYLKAENDFLAKLRVGLAE